MLNQQPPGIKWFWQAALFTPAVIIYAVRKCHMTRIRIFWSECSQ